jgi:hypothetical protein
MGITTDSFRSVGGRMVEIDIGSIIGYLSGCSYR